MREGIDGDQGLPGTYLLHLAELAQRWGVSENDLFEGTGVRKKDLADPAVIVSLPVVLELADRARRLTAEPGIGILLGLQTHTSVHGYLGFAVMSAMTVRQAIALVVAYAPIRTMAFSFELRLDGPKAFFTVHERADLGNVRDVVLAALLIGVWQIGNMLLGREMRDSTVHLALPLPDYYKRFQHVRPAIRFEQESHALVFDAATLDLPLATADPASLRLLSEQCDQLLRSMVSRSGLVQRVQRLVVRSEGGLRSLDEVATALGTSERTLRRRLAEEGKTFAALRDAALRDRATLLLRSQGMPVDKVAQRLGYANLGNFIRAFRRWTGQTPSTFKKGRVEQE